MPREDSADKRSTRRKGDNPRLTCSVLSLYATLIQLTPFGGRLMLSLESNLETSYLKVPLSQRQMVSESQPVPVDFKIGTPTMG